MQLKMGPASDCSFECELELPHCYVLYKLIESGWFMIPEWHYRIPSRAQGLQVAFGPTLHSLAYECSLSTWTLSLVQSSLTFYPILSLPCA